jgi:hypothetical protein
VCIVIEKGGEAEAEGEMKMLKRENHFFHNIKSTICGIEKESRAHMEEGMKYIVCKSYPKKHQKWTSFYNDFYKNFKFFKLSLKHEKIIFTIL